MSTKGDDFNGLFPYRLPPGPALGGVGKEVRHGFGSVYQDTFFTSEWVPVVENVFGKVPTFRPVLCFASRALLGKILGLHTFI